MIFLLSTLGIFGCSDSDLEVSQTNAIEKVVEKVSQPQKNGEFTNFKNLSEKGLSQGFDIKPEGLSATLLRLGNVLLDTQGSLSIFPTPSYQNGELSSARWRYQTRFEGMGRNTLSKTDLMGTTLSGQGIVMTYQNVKVEYEHRASGLEQLITIESKPEGQGKVRVAFSAPDAFDYLLSEKKNTLHVFHNEKNIFDWSNLLTLDASGKTLTSTMILEDGKIIYEINDQNAVYPIVIDPLANTPNTTLTGTSAGNFGIAIHSAGDVNNDGFDDLIVGESEFSNGNNQEGRALIFPGSAIGIGATALWTVEGGADFAKMGSAVLGIGDINHDGFDDVAVGAELAGGFQGRAFVYLGAIAPSGTPIFTAIAPNPTIEAFGSNLAAGDFNCDGRTDLAVSAHLYDDGGPGNDWGRVLVYGGDNSAQLFNNTPLEISSPAPQTFFGRSLGSGNFNGDSVGGNACDDLVIGQPRYTLGGAARRGRVSIYFGDNINPPVVGWSAEGSNKDSRFGFSVGSGDVNNDGLDDLVVGAYHAEAGQTGNASLYVGNSDAAMMSTTPAWRVSGQIDAKFGRDVDIVNTDGNSFGDILVTAEKHVFSGGLTEGAVFIYFNGSGIPSTTPLWTETEGGNANSNYGWVGGSAGDVNNDGLEDIFVGAFGTDGLPNPLGHAYVYHGRGTCTIGGQIFANGDVNPSNPCEACNPLVSATSYTALPNGSSCDDSDACTIADSCQAGSCTGTVETCNDNNPCTDETCDSVMGCLFLTAPNDGDTCLDDGETCTNDVCLNGICDHPIDNNSCFIGATCYSEGGSEPNSPCMQCAPGTSKTSFTAASAGATCDDGLFCTTGDICDAIGQCDGGPRDCSGVAGPCVDATACNEATDQCIVDALKPNGAACNSGDLCNAGTCGIGGICTATNPVDCSAFDSACMAGVCDPNDGSCSAIMVTDGTACDDGDLCTMTESCQSGICTAGTPVDCNDGNECTNDACDPNTGACININTMNGSACTDDGIACTNESCQEGICKSEIMAGACLISGLNACVMDGALDPGNVCRVCNSGLLPTDYSDVPLGTTCAPTVCNADQSGTQESNCDGNGGCIPQPVLDCGAYVCDPLQSTCFTECLTLAECETGAVCSSDGVTPGICVTEKPAAIIDGPQQGNCSEEIVLDASNSTDPNGLALTYLWTQIGGPDVITNIDTMSAELRFSLPALMETDTMFRFRVVVSNGAFDSDPQEWLINGVACPTVMEPGSDMGDAGDMGDIGSDLSSDTSSDLGNDTSDASPEKDTSDNDLTTEIHGSGCLCSSTTKYPSDASWLLLLAFFGVGAKRRKKRNRDK